MKTPQDIEIETEERIETIEEIPTEEEIVEFLRESGINEKLQDVTLEHTKKRLEVLLALAEEGKDKKLVEHKKELKNLLNNLKGHEDKRAEMQAIRDVFRQYQDSYSTTCGSFLDQKHLDEKIKKALREYKKHEKFKKHEEKIAQGWFRELNK
ncbi:hypothetical protein [Clostridium tarantellae]|uniref:Uncharacterized protein n=1 Tax=Clostridium tarantellae TaxID=39493 RepID=A0A6I1ML31_9CLOT|nr:hypothetical protein [Clostridium tarantellae]MPQ44105.1 hypothetical protein [Clostridium tarantellae]